MVIAAPWSANHSDRSGDERCKQADLMEWRLVSYYLSIKSKFLYAVSYVMVPVPGIFLRTAFQNHTCKGPSLRFHSERPYEQHRPTVPEQAG